MKRFLFISVLACLFSCSGHIDDTDPSNVPDGVLRIFADRTSIKADGQQAVTFTVKYGSKDVSKDSNMSLIYEVDGKEISVKPGQNTFSSTVPSEYRFTARYYSDGAHYSDNEVVVKVVAAGVNVGQKYYYQKLWGMQFTAVSCTYCPMLTSALKQMMDQEPDRVVLTAFHVIFDEHVMADPMRVDANEDIRDIVSHDTGLPLFAFNMMKTEEKITSERELIDAQRNTILSEYPSTCGAAVKAELKGDEIVITGRVTSNVSEKLRYHMFLLEDGIEYNQAGADGVYTHDNVVRAVVAGNRWGDNLNSGLPVEVGVEVSVTKTVKVNKDWNTARMWAVFAVISQEGDTFICNNISECALGSESDYMYN